MNSPLEAGSPPPAQLDQAPRQLPSLPIEILQRIIQLALPRLSFNTFRERYAVLLTCCRVNKLWAALAQRELWKQAGFSTIEHMKQFHAARATYGEANNLSRWFKGNRNQLVSVADILSGSSDLMTLYYSTTCRSITVSLKALSVAAPELQVLALDFFQLTEAPPANFAFAHLRRLALSCPTHRADLFTFLQNAELPLLDDLGLALNDLLGLLESEHLGWLGQTLRRHAPKVKRFAFAFVNSSRRLCLPQDVWPTFTALEHLVLDTTAPLGTILPSLPTQLTSFRLRFPHRKGSEVPPWNELLETMRSRPQALESLSELILPTRASTESASADEEEIEEMS